MASSQTTWGATARSMSWIVAVRPRSTRSWSRRCASRSICSARSTITDRSSPTMPMAISARGADSFFCRRVIARVPPRRLRDHRSREMAKLWLRMAGAGTRPNVAPQPFTLGRKGSRETDPSLQSCAKPPLRLPQARLDQVLDRFREVEARMGAATGGAEIVKLSKEHAEPKPVAEPVERLAKLTAERAELDVMAADPEMADMVRDEMADLDEKLPAL